MAEIKGSSKGNVMPNENNPSDVVQEDRSKPREDKKHKSSRKEDRHHHDRRHERKRSRSPEAQGKVEENYGEERRNSPSPQRSQSEVSEYERSRSKARHSSRRRSPSSESDSKEKRLNAIEVALTRISTLLTSRPEVISKPSQKPQSMGMDEEQSGCRECERLIKEVLPKLNKKGSIAEEKATNAICVGGYGKTKRFAVMPCPKCYRLVLQNLGLWCDTLRENKKYPWASHLIMLMPSIFFSATRETVFSSLVDTFGDVVSYDIIGGDLYLRLCFSTKGHSNYFSQNHLVLTQYFKSEGDKWIMCPSMSNYPAGLSDKLKVLQTLLEPGQFKQIEESFQYLCVCLGAIEPFAVQAAPSIMKSEWDL